MTKDPSPFAQKVYDLTRQVPKGKVTTYKALAEAMGTRSYRAIGQVLRCNPYAPTVPCHRVVASTGLLNGFNGSTGRRELLRKTKLLQAEGVRVRHNALPDFPAILHTFSRLH